MPKNKTQPVNPLPELSSRFQEARLQEPRTGSKSMKNAKHSHAKHGEGS
ncbi:hypothetical protein Ga0466249_003348 [Sporomusaceae bacterium BoRhaA]|nr:hypothetical protein [Pelorhabdus rhamnosifermentans]MBU2702221.1 hypothetical protein [Pelorhabdus rhamnosifermentans]